MKKGDIVEGIVVRTDYPNKGVILSNDKKQIIVKNVIPGQRLRVLIRKARKGKYEGQVLNILEKSSSELMKPACVHADVCGGCTYQSLPYEKQLALKERQVKELLSSVIDCYEEKPTAYEFLPVKPSPKQQEYRNKMEFSFGDEIKDGPLALGMHKKNSFYDIVSVSGCRIVDQDFRKILSVTLNYFGERQISYYHKLRHTGYLRHLLVRKSAKTGEILIDLVTTTQVSSFCEDELLSGYREVLLRESYLGVLTGLLHTKNDSVADAIINEGTAILFGHDYFFEELLGLRFKITPFSFFQTNSKGAEVLYETVREMIGNSLAAAPASFQIDSERSRLDGKVVYDLYSGTGTIAQMLAPVAKKVIGVEIVPEAVEAAKENARMNHLNNCEFIAGDVLKVLADIKEKPDYIVLDPPRDGIHPKVLKQIIHYGVAQMIYISCKASSLARDLVELQAGGYRVEKICCVDLFPGTVHVETVCLLSKLNVEHHIEVDVNLDEMDLTKAESKATYEEIKEYVLEHSGLKVSNLYIAQVKRKCGIVERINYNLPKSENTKQPKCPLEKEAAIMKALEYFRMI